MQPPTLSQVLRGDIFYVAYYADKDGELYVDFATCRVDKGDCERAMRINYKHVDYCGVLLVKVEKVE